MAIYHCSVSNVSRGKGSNACATLSYIAARTVRCSRTGETFSYGRRQRVAERRVMLPQSAPARYADPAVLFDELESYEKAGNARVAKKVVVALPRELDMEEWRSSLRDFCAPLVEQGYACVFAVHEDTAGENPHAHILIANRQLGDDGKWKKAKTRKAYALDENGERVPLIDKRTGKQKLGKRNERLWKRETVDANPLDQRETLVQMRERWTEVCNERLVPGAHIDHRSHAERGLEELPTVHEGYAARAMEARGETSERCEFNRCVRSHNEQIRAVAVELAKLHEEKETALERAAVNLAAAAAVASGKTAEEVAQEVTRQRELSQMFGKLAEKAQALDDEPAPPNRKPATRSLDIPLSHLQGVPLNGIGSKREADVMPEPISGSKKMEDGSTRRWAFYKVAVPASAAHKLGLKGKNWRFTVNDDYHIRHRFGTDTAYVTMREDRELKLTTGAWNEDANRWEQTGEKKVTWRELTQAIGDTMRKLARKAAAAYKEAREREKERERAGKAANKAAERYESYSAPTVRQEPTRRRRGR